jgi:cell division protein FtsI/penicillin-binding protein 2
MARVRPVFVRNLTLAVGLGVAAFALAGSGGGDGAATDVHGGSLAHKGERVAEAATLPKSKAEKKLPRTLVGDASFAGELDLSRMELVGDHYEVPLPNGRRAVLTLNPELQQAAEKVLRTAKAPRGAVVVTATDGRILAYAGRRTADWKGGKEGTYDTSLANTVWAPAASIFKIATAAALVEAGVDPHGRVCYHGGLRSVMESNLEDDRSDNRCNDLSYGLAHSQNAIIAKLVHKNLEPSKLRTTAASMGFTDTRSPDGSRGGDLPTWALGGQFGSIEIPEEKGVDYGKAAAGFHGSELSPLGGALLANTIATGGLRVTPTIVAEVIDNGARRTVQLPKAERILAEDVARAVGQMMVETCDSGSAAKAFRGRDGLPRDVKVAGKTGTLSRKPAPDAPAELEYSWFVGYAPAEKPAFSVAVVLGNTDLWWLKSHTAARMILRDALRTITAK